MHTLGCTLKLESSLVEIDFILQYDRFINLEKVEPQVLVVKTKEWPLFLFVPCLWPTLRSKLSTSSNLFVFL